MTNLFSSSRLWIMLLAAVITSLVMSNTYAAKGGNSGGGGLSIEDHDAQVKVDIAQHDTDITNDLVTHDDNMTVEHGNLETKLDVILDAVTNGSTTCPDAPVAKTGQTVSYGSLDDGTRQGGVAWPVPRFTDNQDGTVTDNLTHLIWMTHPSQDTGLWSQALDRCNNMASPNTFEHLTDGSDPGDWHLANIREFQSLFHYGYHFPALPNTLGTGQASMSPDIDHPWGPLIGPAYWTSTTHALEDGKAWCLDVNAWQELNSKIAPQFAIGLGVVRTRRPLMLDRLVI